MNVPLAPARPADCLSDFVLDQLVAGDLAGDAGAKAREHLALCKRCSGRLDAFASIEIPALAPPTTRPASSSKRRRSLSPAFLAAAAAALVAMVVVLAIPIRHGEQELIEVGTRTKGVLTLGLIVRRPSGEVVRLAPGDAVHPGDSIRFEIAGSRGGFVAVLGIDAAGVVTVYAPHSGSMVKLGAGTAVVLDETIVADDTLGAERVTALLCPEPLTVAELRAAGERVLARASGDPRRIETLGTTCAETSVVIEKRRAR